MPSKVTILAILAMLICLAGCTRTPAGNAGGPSLAERTGKDWVPGDEPPIVYDEEEGKYVKSVIPNIETPEPEPPAMITYTGQSN